MLSCVSKEDVLEYARIFSVTVGLFTYLPLISIYSLFYLFIFFILLSICFSLCLFTYIRLLYLFIHYFIDSSFSFFFYLLIHLFASFISCLFNHCLTYISIPFFYPLFFSLSTHLFPSPSIHFSLLLTPYSAKSSGLRMYAMLNSPY